MQTIDLRVTTDELEVVRSLLLRSVAADREELRRLNMLSTAYADHGRGDVASRELDQVRRRMAAAQGLLEQLAQV